MTQVVNLFRLQKIDTRRDQVAARLAEINRLVSQDRSLIDAQSARDAADQALQAARAVLKQAETAVQAVQIKIEESEHALYGGRIKSPKELQDLQAEIAALKRQLATLEDRQIEAMLVSEAREGEASQAAASLTRVQGEVATRHAALFGEQATLQREGERLDAERKATASAIPAEDLALYDRLRQAKRGLAVAAVDEESCQACGSSLTPAEIQTARAPGKSLLCPSCGRILYAG